MRFNRRSVLRGLVRGAAVCVGVPTLDAFLNGNGTAWADGAKLPVRFGTYFWGLGLTDTPAGGSRWVPKTVGFGYEETPELASISALRHKVSVFSGFRVIGDGKSNYVHWSGTAGINAGASPAKNGAMEGPSFDTMIASAIGGTTRFRQLDISASGKRTSYSTPNGTTYASAEGSVMSLYNRIFGEGFQDPNDPNWKPSQEVILRRSVLSAVGEQRKALVADLGAADRAKLDQYFTSLREVENQLALQLERPAECEACVVPDRPGDVVAGIEVHQLNAISKTMAKLLAMGLACNQTRVFNFQHSEGASQAYIQGESKTYHQVTHDEPTNAQLGYQKHASELADITMVGLGDFLREMDAIKEGAGTLLDNSLVFADTDTGYAKVHALENIPILFAGGAGGAHKAGQHIAAPGEPTSRLVLTAMNLAGVRQAEFGMGAMKTSRLVTEVMA
jgi:hypothetical protein